MTVSVVLGATGVVGCGAVKHFLKLGATVVAPVRGDPKKLLENLGEAASHQARLHTPNFQFGEREGAFGVASWIKDNIPGGQVDHVFVVGGGMAPYSPISGITEAQYQEMTTTKIFPQLFAAQALIPLLRNEETSSYTVVAGALGEVCFSPPLALTTLANAAVFGLVLGIQAEEKGKKYRVNELRISALITYDGQSGHAYFPGSPAAPTSRLAQFYYDNVANALSVRDTVVRVGDIEVGLK